MRNLKKKQYVIDSCWSLPLWIPAFVGMTKGAGMTL